MTGPQAGGPPAAGAHGGDGAAIASWLGVAPEQVLDLSASLNPFAPEVAPLLARHAGAARRYGDPTALEQRLAELAEADPGVVVATNGASEAIALVAALVERGRVDEPEFSLYRRHLDLDPTAGRWRSNPHAPSGRLADPGDVAAVWDEAYWPLATGTWTRGDHRHGAFVTGSATKLFATPGLRVGWVVAPDPEQADRIRRRRPEWSVSALAADVTLDLLDDLDLRALAARVASARGALTAAVAARLPDGARIEAHDAPWILVHGVPTWRNDLARRGVVVRDCSSFGLAGTVRIAIPDEAGLTRLVDAIDHLTDEEP